ncbi:hypothetical protein JXA48_00870 [Candidatus Woesearchaeota archaeon]|nr:hypothetical protein [Candidatus Woesearchaeota archaeon]
MNESFLKKTSILVFFIGFVGLICLFLFQKPFFVSLNDDIPLDSEFSLNISVLDFYQTSSGTLILFSYEKMDSAFFKGNASFLEKGSNVQIVGSKNGDYFSIDQLILT